MSHVYCVALVPAYNEEASIGATIEALLAQTRVPDRIVVIPNGCTDNTADVARRYPVTVMELPRLAHRKSEALNLAWNAYAKDADVVVGMDADTVLPPTSVADWIAELEADPTLGGSSSRFTMIQPGLLPRLQKHEFAAWTSTALRKGDTHVLAGTGCAFNGQALRDVAALNGDDMEEEAWTHLANTRPRNGTRGSTPESSATARASVRTGSHGPTPTGRSRQDSSSVTNATTLHVSDSTTSSSEPKATTCETPQSAVGTSTRKRTYAHSAEGHTPTIPPNVPVGALFATSRTRTNIEHGTVSASWSGSGSIASETVRFSLEKSENARGGNGPWSYHSATEDFRLTMRMRQLGYRAQVSPTVRAYTDSMRTLRALNAQRHKWSTGTVEDLLHFGVTRLTLRDWGQQIAGIFGAFLKLLWLVVIFGQWAYFGELNIFWIWWLLPVLFVAVEVKRVMRVPHRDWKDIALAVSFFPNEFFMWMRSAWFIRSWVSVLTSKVTGRRRDVWHLQAIAEGV